MGTAAGTISKEVQDGHCDYRRMRKKRSWVSVVLTFAIESYDKVSSKSERRLAFCSVFVSRHRAISPFPYGKEQKSKMSNMLHVSSFDMTSCRGVWSTKGLPDKNSISGCCLTAVADVSVGDECR